VVFSSIVFLFYFLPAFLVVYTAVPGTRLKNLVLLLVSLLFYAWGEPGFVFVLCGQILFNYRAALAIDASHGRLRKHATAAGVDEARVLNPRRRFRTRSEGGDAGRTLSKASLPITSDCGSVDAFARNNPLCARRAVH